MKEKVKKITDEYGQLHYKCSLNTEGGSDDGCDCAVKEMVKEVVACVVEYLSHDMKFKDEEQRKSAVKMYLDDFNEDN